MIKAAYLIMKKLFYAIRYALKSATVWAMRRVLARRQLLMRVLVLISHFPGIKHHLRLLAIRAGIIPDTRAGTNTENPLAAVVENGKICMPVRATAIFKALQHVVAERNQ